MGDGGVGDHFHKIFAWFSSILCSYLIYFIFLLILALMLTYSLPLSPTIDDSCKLSLVISVFVSGFKSRCMCLVNAKIFVCNGLVMQKCTTWYV